VAFAMPLNVGEGVTSVTFTMLYISDYNKPYNKPGDYFITFWFEKEGEEDEDYYIIGKHITEGANTIPFSSFTRR
jgi:hypothetical protein